ncbi:hypothetical protein DV737_g5124, partial [Chaetothyriales sp. CBS 132003]
MSNFFLPPDSPFAGTLVQVPHILNPRDLLAFRPFTDWLATLSNSFALQSTNPAHPFHSSPYRLHSINIQTVDFFRPGPGATRPRIGFLKLQADISNSKHENLPGGVFMRGGSVAMLIIITPTDDDGSGGRDEHSAQSTTTTSSKTISSYESEADEYVVLTIQPRIPTGSLAFVELPAGMIDDAGSFAGAAAKEIKEETGMDIKEDELIDLTKLASESASASSDPPLTSSSGGVSAADEKDRQQEDVLQSETLALHDALYASPGGSDEFIPVLAARKRLNRRQIEELQGKMTGLRDKGEKITLKLVRLKDLWKVGARDAKTVAAWGLWEGLRREGKV